MFGISNYVDKQVIQGGAHCGFRRLLGGTQVKAIRLRLSLKKTRKLTKRLKMIATDNGPNPGSTSQIWFSVQESK